MMGPIIGGIILVAIAATLLIILAAPLYKYIGAGVLKILRPFREHKSTDEKEDEWVTYNFRNGEKK